MQGQACGDSSKTAVNELKSRCGSTDAAEKNWIFMNFTVNTVQGFEDKHGICDLFTNWSAWKLAH